MQKPKLNNKKLQEIECVKRFLKNKGIQFKEEEIRLNPKEDDVADVYFKKKKFQVVKSSFKLWEVAGKLKKGKPSNSGEVKGEIKKIEGVKTPYIEFTYKKDEVFQKFIAEPIQKKAKYKNCAKGTILLLDCWTSEPPWLKEQLKIAKKLSGNIEFLKQTGFDEIYLVCWKKNIQIYP